LIGLGTLINVFAILSGATLGVLLGNRINASARDIVTDALGLVTLLIGAFSVVAITDPDLLSVISGGGAVLTVLAALVVGGLIGNYLKIEERMEHFGERLKNRFAKKNESSVRFVEGFVSASLVFAVGPLAILGSISDGLGRGIDQLVLKSTLDFFASIAFAASLGWGVAFSALVVGLYQGLFTLIGFFLGEVLSLAAISILNAVGGLLLIGVGIRLLRLRQIPVADLLPALILAPLFLFIATVWL
jgi:uncharacterized protein